MESMLVPLGVRLSRKYDISMGWRVERMFQRKQHAWHERMIQEFWIQSEIVGSTN